MKTFKKAIKISGVGIHSGEPVNMVINPSKAPGIFFHRADLGAGLIPATYDNVFSANLNTTIGVAPNCVQTIEHLMAALFIVGIDGAVIEIDGAETPIMDGSAAEFIKIFDAAGTAQHGAMRKIIVKKEVIAYRRELIGKMPLMRRIMLWLHNLKTGRKENGFVRLSAGCEGLEINATLDYPDKIIGVQTYQYLFDGSEKSKKTFIKDIARSRTFGRFWEWEYLKKRGQGRGANETNVIALDNTGGGTLNKLHSPDEFVRHKIIDALGDMYTSGGFVVGRLESYKGSHGLNNLVLKKLFSDPSNYDIV